MLTTCKYFLIVLFYNMKLEYYNNIVPKIYFFKNKINFKD